MVRALLALPLPLALAAFAAAGCGEDRGPATRHTVEAVLATPHDWVGLGTTGSITGPRLTVLAVRGRPHPAASTGPSVRVVLVSAQRARRLFRAVAGRPVAGPPAEVSPSCADCGNPYAKADGRSFRPDAAVRREFARLTADG